VPIRNAAALLKRDSLDAGAIRRAAEIIERQANGMSRLISDLVDVSRMEQGGLEMRRERVPLSDLVDRALESAGPHASERGHTLSISVSHESIYLQMDVLRVGQSLQNIIANASKYTDEYGHIHVRAQREDAWVVITVRDTGIGIPPDELETIFGLFVRSARNAYGGPGLGIGLYLARHFVEAHGGTVTAASAGAGRGSEFTIRLPCESATA
jgi:signal transduction histidine kinase